jgi:hypothetical protein
MTRLPSLILAGCVVCAGLIFIEFGSIGNHRPSSGARLPAASQPAALEFRKLADALSSPNQHHPETPSSANDTHSLLRDVRLTGVLIGPDVRIAIFAVTGAGPLVLSEGDALEGWRLDSISPRRVVLSGAAGSIVLQPRPDPNLVRPPSPAAVQSDQPEPGVPSGAGWTDAPRQPLAAAPIAVGNFWAATPVQTQGYPYYSPQYYAGDDQYYPSYDYYPFLYSFPYFGYAVPTGTGFRFGFFHHGVGFRQSGFLHSGFFHGGALHGGSRGGRR